MILLTIGDIYVLALLKCALNGKVVFYLECPLVEVSTILL